MGTVANLALEASGQKTKMAATVPSILVFLACLTAVYSKYIVRDTEGRAVLEVLFSQNASLVYKDERTLIWDYLGVWEPLEEPSFWLLGHKAQGDWDPMRGNVMMVKDIIGDTQGLFMRSPLDFREIWRDEGGFGVQDVAFWRPVCPEGFNPLGDIAYACEWCGWPKPLSYLSRMRCLSREVTELCGFRGSPLWTNDGGWENQRGSVWEIGGGPGISTFFHATQGWDNPPQNSVAFCLKDVEYVED